MTMKTPEALAVLDVIARGMDDFCQIKYGEASSQAEKLRKARAAFAAEHAALKTAQWMLERDYIDDQKMAVIDKCRNAMAAVEKLP